MRFASASFPYVNVESDSRLSVDAFHRLICPLVRGAPTGFDRRRGSIPEEPVAHRPGRWPREPLLLSFDRMDPERVESDRELLQIGEVADLVGLSLRTVRYYEEVGLVNPSARTQGGFRLYSQDDIERLRILKGMKPLGLSLEEIRELMELFDRSAEELEPAGVESLVTGLEKYATISDEHVERLERHLVEARRLRSRIKEQLNRSRAAGERVTNRRR